MNFDYRVMANAQQVKPRLAFFTYRYDPSLPEFLSMHHGEHINCLSQFFDVFVVDQDADYQDICDRIHPDLAVFETGLNLLSCRRPKIKNVRSSRSVPKVALINADAWCETRAGTISEMEQWDVEAAFSISVTAAEHMRSMWDRIFVWPNCVDPQLYHDYGESKIIPVLLTGAKGPQYPWRRKLYQLVADNYPSMVCPHLGYGSKSSAGQVLFGERYARAINASLIVPTCGTVAKEVVRKHFEIPACKACLVTERSPGLEAAGFVDLQNCVFANEDDILDKIEFLFRRPERLAAITEAGYTLIHSRHSTAQRDQFLQWLNLRRTLRNDQRIVQKGPFAPLAVVGRDSRERSGHLISEGFHLQLLKEGDRLLAAGNYEAAKQSYLHSLEFMRRLPEAKFRLAVCNLHLGNPAAAEQCLFENVQYTVADYKAADPDPVEWAYYILALLCSGRIDEGAVRAGEFLHLRHTELDRARRATFILKSGQFSDIQSSGIEISYRPSIHEVRVRTEQDWIDFACQLLAACGQQDAASLLGLNAGVWSSMKCQDGETGNEASLLHDKKPFPYQHSNASSFRRKLFYAKVRERLSDRFAHFFKRSVKKSDRVPRQSTVAQSVEAGVQSSSMLRNSSNNSTGKILPNEFRSTVGQ